MGDCIVDLLIIFITNFIPPYLERYITIIRWGEIFLSLIPSNKCCNTYNTAKLSTIVIGWERPIKYNNNL